MTKSKKTKVPRLNPVHFLRDCEKRHKIGGSIKFWQIHKTAYFLRSMRRCHSVQTFQIHSFDKLGNNFVATMVQFLSILLITAALASPSLAANGVSLPKRSTASSLVFIEWRLTLVSLYYRVFGGSF
jgi:hypothetical protein